MWLGAFSSEKVIKTRSVTHGTSTEQAKVEKAKVMSGDLVL